VARGVPLYVIDIDARRNRVIVGSREELMHRSLVASKINLLVRRAEASSVDPIRVTAKIRYNAQPQPARLTRTGEDEIRVDFDHPQSAITPGQAVVCYDGETVLAGGWIDRVVD
jgi:tRNA-specific 2-thiouridylase